MTKTKDEYLGVEMLSYPTNASLIPYLALHQDYSERAVSLCDIEEDYDSAHYESIAVKRLLTGDRGHYGPIEHLQFVFTIAGFPHLVMQQLRTHRVGVSFDVQSLRYTGTRLVEASNGGRALESVFYLPDEWTEEDIEFHKIVLARYCKERETCKEERARYCIPYNVRQHFVLSANLRALFHLFDVRLKGDVQDITRECVGMIFNCCERSGVVPTLFQWYKENRYNKGRLAP